MQLEKKEPVKRYNIIYADPPWDYGNKALWDRGGANDHYMTQGVEWIARLPIERIAAWDCACFMWATFPRQHERSKMSDCSQPLGLGLSEELGVMDEKTMDLKATAEKHGLGWLLDPQDEHCRADQLTAFAFEIARRAAAEGWRWCAKSAADSYNDQVADEAPEHAPDLMAQNVLIGGA